MEFACTSTSDTIFTSFLCALDSSVKELREVRVVRDFPDVFDEIPGPLPKREVEFRIDLVPGSAPVAKSPYQLAQKELEEMKRQLQTLMDKG